MPEMNEVPQPEKASRKDRFKRIIGWIWGHRILVAIVLGGLLLWWLLSKWALFSIWRKVETKPDTPVTVNGDSVNWTDPTGQPKKAYKNPSAKVDLKPILDPGTGKPKIEPRIQEAGLSLVPQAHIVYDFTQRKSTWLAGAQLAFLDAFGVGPALNDQMAGLILDRRFKLSNISNIAVAAGAVSPFDPLFQLRPEVHFVAGFSLKAGF